MGSWALADPVAPEKFVQCALVYRESYGVAHRVQSEKILIRHTQRPCLQFFFSLKIMPRLAPSIILQAPSREICSCIFAFLVPRNGAIGRFRPSATLANAHDCIISNRFSQVWCTAGPQLESFERRSIVQLIRMRVIAKVVRYAGASDRSPT